MLWFGRPSVLKDEVDGLGPTARVHAFRSARQATIVDETSRPRVPSLGCPEPRETPSRM
jgi:hypothetical protein